MGSTSLVVPADASKRSGLIPIGSADIAGLSVQTVNARDLHTFLGSQQRFADWIKARIRKYEFVENQDYLIHRIMIQVDSGTKHQIEYHLTIDMAKELSMVERTPKGKQARRYFLDCERRLLRLAKRHARQAEDRAMAEWQQMRLEGKDARRHETDAIKEFVEYATAQGSANASRYYCNLTKMTHKALFLVEQGLGRPGSLRDMLNGMQLTFLATAEYVAANALRDGMTTDLPYKDIYLLAKVRVESYAATVGRTPLLTH